MPQVIDLKSKTLKIKIVEEKVETAIREKSVAKFWEQQTLKNPALFNGDTFLLDEAQSDLSGKELTFAVYPADYATHLYNHKMENGNKAIFVSTVVQTSDHKLLLGKMGKHTANSGIVQFVGGSFDLADVNGNEIDYKQAIEREIFEEVPIRYADVVSCDPLAIVRDDNYKTSIVFLTKLKITSEELARLFKSMRLPEFEEVIFVSLDQKSFVDFMFSNGNYAFYIKPTIEHYQKLLLNL